ncbi:CD209 antigen-like protein C [Brachyistius frenatus]|uniref:CD209 antigen-like protein C n=1 Tax=Brachyistius frenatus TaxID=100188 RepID=UPI0037E7C850
MDDSGNSGGVSDEYSKLPGVSMSTLRPASRVNHYKLLAGILAVLAAILLVVDIGLGVYYNKLTDGNDIVTDIASEMTKLHATYDAAIKSRDEVKKQLQLEISEQQVTKWELDHQSRRSRDYQKQTDKLQMEIAALKSHMPMIEEGCRHCLPGWTFMNSVCYYFPLSDTISHKSWLDARQFCKKQGGDLASIQSREEHLAVAELVNNYQDSSRHVSHSGFWIGLRDVEEGIWKWPDGTRITEGYWNDGEPNDQGNEDCVAIYPRSNPFKAWNDAPCAYSLKWICEMEPRSSI